MTRFHRGRHAPIWKTTTASTHRRIEHISFDASLPYFKYWKGSFRESGELRLIEDDNVGSIENILDKFEEEGLMGWAPLVVPGNK